MKIKALMYGRVSRAGAIMATVAVLRLGSGPAAHATSTKRQAPSTEPGTGTGTGTQPDWEPITECTTGTLTGAMRDPLSENIVVSGWIPVVGVDKSTPHPSCGGCY